MNLGMEFKPNTYIRSYHQIPIPMIRLDPENFISRLMKLFLKRPTEEKGRTERDSLTSHGLLMIEYTSPYTFTPSSGAGSGSRPKVFM